MIRVLLAFALFGCGSKQSAPATPPAGSGSAEHAEHEGSGEGEHEMLPELTKFHDLLSPLWHAAKGAQRTKDTCNAVPQFASEADAIAKATPPRTANADTWTNGTRGLVAAVGELKTVCEAKDEPRFEAAFEKLHNAFHALMEAGGMHH